MISLNDTLYCLPYIAYFRLDRTRPACFHGNTSYGIFLLANDPTIFLMIHWILLFFRVRIYFIRFNRVLCFETAVVHLYTDITYGYRAFLDGNLSFLFGNVWFFSFSYTLINLKLIQRKLLLFY